MNTNNNVWGVISEVFGVAESEYCVRIQSNETDSIVENELTVYEEERVSTNENSTKKISFQKLMNSKTQSTTNPLMMMASKLQSTNVQCYF